MNFTIAFFVGSATFVLMMLLKIPIKHLTAYFADRADFEMRDVLYKRYNIVLQILTMALAYIIYMFVLKWLGDDHFKLCCSMKAGVIAIALYSVYERFL